MNKELVEKQLDNHAEEAPIANSIPTAIVESSRLTLRDLFRGSYMWLVALVCFGVAVGVAWSSMPAEGIDITIRFPDGHGLAAEDAVRFRGIDVGIVEEVKLNGELTGVDVRVSLLPFAEPLAREGTRFWIVRPELSLAGVSGLETAVGHKYIGLIPASPEASPNFTFEGLATSPPDATGNQGIEILVRGDKRFSVTVGSPVHYRGVEVGRVLSVGISPDGLKVDARLRIFDRFTKLITSESVFWASGGIDASFSALSGGLSFEMESLETLMQGGVSVLTIASGGKPIEPGDDFVLFGQPEKDWLESANQVQSTAIELRGAVPIELLWKQPRLLGMGVAEKRLPAVAALVSSAGRDFVVLPADLLQAPEKLNEGTFEIGIQGLVQSRQAVPSLAIGASPNETDAGNVNEQGAKKIDSAGKLVRIAIDSLPPNHPLDGFSPDEIRPWRVGESCVAVRATLGSEQEIGSVRLFPTRIDGEDIAESGLLKSFDGDRSVWHGAPVLAERDGALLGVLSITDLETRILPLDAAIDAK